MGAPQGYAVGFGSLLPSFFSLLRGLLTSDSGNTYGNREGSRNWVPLAKGGQEAFTPMALRRIEIPISFILMALVMHVITAQLHPLCGSGLENRLHHHVWGCLAAT